MPANTGNIGRTCVATGSRLHLIEPLGFRLSKKEIRRSGLDYWEKLEVFRYSDYREFLEKNPSAASSLYMATTKARYSYDEIAYPRDCYFLFGKESAGIPEELLLENRERCIRIPMQEEIRSLNLSNSVAIILYEALRQRKFENLCREGNLHHLRW